MMRHGSDAAGRGPAATEPTPQARAGAEGGPVRIVINTDWCKGCYICVSVCPRNVLTIDQTEWTGSFHPIVVAQPERCTVCRNCELLCPDLAIEVLADDGDGLGRSLRCSHRQPSQRPGQ